MPPRFATYDHLQRVVCDAIAEVTADELLRLADLFERHGLTGAQIVAALRQRAARLTPPETGDPT